ncbi:hypothetical protein [Eudoraea sp.]
MPVLAEVDPDLFGIAFMTVDGNLHTDGDTKVKASSAVSLLELDS